MPTISQLDLTMSRDSNGVVAARVEYALEFVQFEVDANPLFTEQVALVRGVGERDRWELPVPGRGTLPMQVRGSETDSGDDRVVVMFSTGEVDAAALGVTLVNGVGTAKRSFEHVLSRAELELLLEAGRDHPYNGYVFFATLADSDSYKRFEEVGVLGQAYPTGGTEPVAIAVTATTTWVANAGSNTVTQLSPNGVESTTDVAGRPVALVLGPDGLAYVAVPEAGNVFAIDAAGTIVRNFAMPAQHGLAYGDGFFVASMADMPGAVLFQASGAATGVNMIDTSLRGVAVGAGAIWIASGWHNMLLKHRLPDGQLLSRYPVGEGPDAVVFDADRVYVANRVARTVSIVRA